MTILPLLVLALLCQPQQLDRKKVYRQQFDIIAQRYAVSFNRNRP